MSRSTAGRPVRLAAAAVALSVLAACSSSAGGSGGASGNSGGSGGSGSDGSGSGRGDITIGLVTSTTGPASATLKGVVDGAKARFDQQNAAGGVNGHQINLVVGDDGGTPQGAQTAVNNLIQQKHAFALIFMSVVTQTAYRVAQQQDVPVVGGALDGPEWGTKPNTNMVSVGGNQAAYQPAYSFIDDVAKDAGATNMATLGIQGIPSSIVDTKAVASSLRSVGIKVPYENYSLPLGTVDVGPTVLGMKKANTDGFYSTMLDNTNFAIMTAAKQAGMTMKAPIMAVGYGQALLDSKTTVDSGQGAILSTVQAPVELKTKATLAEQAALKQYGGLSGVPDLNISDSWMSADLIIAGLKNAGSNPTRASFLDALHNTKDWTAGGLLPQAPDLSLANFGKNPTTKCSYFVQLKGSAFVPMNGGKPYCGKALSSQ